MDWLPDLPLENVLVSLCLFGVLALAALALVIFGLINHRNAAASRSWPSVTGQITESRLGEQRSDDSISYYPRITYAYEVNSRGYSGQRLVFGGGLRGNRGPAERMLARYPVGARVPVYYNPASPQEAVLERRSGSSVLFWALAAFLLALGCGAVVCAVLS